MTHLRKMMLEKLQRRHYFEATTQRPYPLTTLFKRVGHLAGRRRT